MILHRAFLSAVGVAVCLAAAAARAGIVDFEDLTLAPESYYEGADLAGQFASRGANFNNSFTDFGGGYTAWEGWAYSNVTDTTTAGFGNQFASFAGAGSRSSANFGVAFTNTFVLPAPIVTLPAGELPISMRVTNTTYAALSMRDGDAFAKKFGGASGNDPDWFLLTVTGLDAADQPLGTVELYLADFRFADPQQDYILDHWVNVNLIGLTGAVKLSFGLTSSDVGEFGVNTPTYVAMDDLMTTLIIGDVNFDGAVNILDINGVSSNWSGSGPEGDANGDGVINILDVNAISSHWTGGGGSVANVPEPNALALVAAGLAGILGWRMLAHAGLARRLAAP